MHKKTIKRTVYITLEKEIEFEVNAENVEYDYCWDPKTDEFTEGKHVEEEWDEDVISAIEQNKHISEFIFHAETNGWKCIEQGLE